MFNKTFYPTNPTTIFNMVQGLEFLNKEVLDPSGGKADILDYVYNSLVQKYGSQPKYKEKNNFKSFLSAVEIEPDLRAIIRSKGYEVIGEDFLKFYPDSFFDIILMNPPFDHGVKHFLKAYEIAEGAAIRCILNKSNVETLHTKERQYLMEILEREKITPVDLGQCFIDAERKTNVEIVLIKVPAKPQKTRFSFQGNTDGEKLHDISDIKTNQLEPVDVIAALVNRYNRSKEIAAQIYKLNKELMFYSDGLNQVSIHTISNSFGEQQNVSSETAYETFVGWLRHGAWDRIINQAKIDELLTSNVKKEFHADQNKQGAAAFTAENIEALIISLMTNAVELKQRCILEAFDILTKFHKDNKVSIDGVLAGQWKTNDAWKINRRVILPYGSCDQTKGRYDWGGIYLNNEDKLIDIEKALCFVTGKKYQDIKKNTISYKCDNNIVPYTYIRKGGKWYWGDYQEHDEEIHDTRRERLAFHQWHDSEFFRFKAFKCGTMHLEFKDTKVYNDFNIAACKGKNWIPADWGHSTTQGQGQKHPKAKAHKTYSTRPAPPPRQPVNDYNIDDLLTVVNDIKQPGEQTILFEV